MKLYVPLPSTFKFQKIFDNNEYLQKYLTQDPRTMSRWYIEEGMDMGELKRVLIGNNINYKFEE